MFITKQFFFFNLEVGGTCTIKTLVKAASSLEELIKVRPAIKDPLKRVEVAQLQNRKIRVLFENETTFKVI